MDGYDHMTPAPKTPPCDSGRQGRTGLPKSVRWLIAVLAVLCVLSCTACVVLLIQRDTETAEAPSLREAVDTRRLEIQAEAEPVPEPEPAEPVAVEPEVSGEALLAAAAESVLYLETYDESGECIATASGFLIDADTLITNYHVVQDAYELYAWTTKERSVGANTLLAYDEVADLAVLRFDHSVFLEPLVLTDSDSVKQGQPVYAVGYPLGLANTMSNGIVSARYVDEYGNDTIQTTAAVSSGSSGGPLLNGAGAVIGVICAYYVDGQNLNVAISSNTLQRLLGQTSEPLPLSEWTDRPLMPDQLWEEGMEGTAEKTPASG